MTGSARPEPRPLDPDEPVTPAVLVLPAIAFDPPFDERRPWLDRYEVTDAYALAGLDEPLYLTAEGVAIATTGMGKAAAATTVTALLTAPGLDLAETTFLSAGIAGGPPTRVALGSVVVADAVVDWDVKHRWDPSERAGDGDEPAIDLHAYRQRDYVYRPDPDLVETAAAAARSVDLETSDRLRAIHRRYDAGVDPEPTVAVGPTLCGDEFWHGRRHAREAAWLCRRYGVDPYLTTEMEDAGTAVALSRRDAVARYCSLRAVVNYDRPAPGESVEESFDGTAESVERGIENLARAGAAVVDRLRG